MASPTLETSVYSGWTVWGQIDTDSSHPAKGKCSVLFPNTKAAFLG